MDGINYVKMQGISADQIMLRIDDHSENDIIYVISENYSYLFIVIWYAQLWIFVIPLDITHEIKTKNV